MFRRVLPTRALLQGPSALLVCGFLVATPLLAQHPTQPHHKHEMQFEVDSLEQQWRQAQLTGDVPAMDKLLSDDFLGITSAGEVVTKAQQLDRMRTRELSLTKLDISDVKIKRVGTSVAIVTSLASIEGTSENRPLTGSFRYTHVFQHLPSGAWKITSFEATRIRPKDRNAPPGASASNAIPTPDKP